METVAEATARFIRALQRVYARKWIFLCVFALVFIASTFVLAVLDLLPSTGTTSTDQPTVTIATSTPAVVAPVVELPLSVKSSAIKLSTTIANPTTTDAKVLDKLLLKGAVRYPTSAKLGEEGNVVLFGHSSYLPIVNNSAYKAFNEIQKFKRGDLITVYSSGRAYTYTVRTVEKKSADDGTIQLSVPGKVLTLVTCNSFATKSDRFVVTADFVESHSLGV